MSQQAPASTSPEATPLARALDQNDSVQETVEQSAAELMVIHAVLTQEIPGPVQTGDVAQALRKTDEMETRIQASAEDLQQVHQLLEQEIDERAELERKLTATQAARARAQRNAS